MGLLRRKLDEWGLAENTILVFVTDNGSSGGATLDRDQFVVGGYNAGMRGIKGSEYDGGHRVPFFLRWPAGGLVGGRDVTELTANVDIMPTLLELCDVDVGPHTLHGRSLVPLLQGYQDGWPDRVLVTDSQRVAYPIKWRKSSVMSGQWRLVDGLELHDIRVDPEQRRDVAEHHPDIVARLRGGYEGWWQLVSEQSDSTIPIPIGTEDGEWVRLTTDDWRNDPVECAWNQSLVREGLECNGYWEIDVTRPGTYRFELRRWPREEDRAVAAGIPGHIKSFSSGIREGWGGGKALPLTRAVIEVGDKARTRSIAADDVSVAFEMDLDAGETRLQTYLYDDDGGEVGAYYVYVELN